MIHRQDSVKNRNYLRLVEIASDITGIKKSVIQSRCRMDSVCEARWLIWWWLRQPQYGNMSMTQIGAISQPMRDHGTVQHGLKVVEARRNDPIGGARFQTMLNLVCERMEEAQCAA